MQMSLSPGQSTNTSVTRYLLEAALSCQSRFSVSTQGQGLSPAFQFSSKQIKMKHEAQIKVKGGPRFLSPHCNLIICK